MTSTQKNGKYNCQESDHESHEFHSLLICGFFHVANKVSVPIETTLHCNKSQFLNSPLYILKFV